MKFKIAVILLLAAVGAHAQTEANLAALQGLVPVAALGGSDAGKVALAANLKVTGQIQQGEAHQPTLLPWAEAQQQALKDAFITAGDAYQLADGLGSKLGGVYQAATRTGEGKSSQFTNVAPTVGHLLAYAMATSGADSNVAKSVFADGTVAGKPPASPAVAAILQKAGGVEDIFGKAYNLPAGSPNANPYGNSRPFQTEPRLATFTAQDFLGDTEQNVFYLHGPIQDLTKSPSYPSGHTTYGYTESVLLALMVPERYPEMIVRGAEYGNSRIILGAHYAMDVLGGRTLALYDLAQLLANKPGYVGVMHGQIEIDDFRKALSDAHDDMAKALSAGCSGAVAVCAQQDDGRFKDRSKDKAFYESTQTYGLGTVFPQNAKGTEEVAKLAPEAGYLLTAAFPYLTLDKADAILTETEGPGGGFLDNGSAFGVYSRLDLYTASLKAIAMAPSRD